MKIKDSIVKVTFDGTLKDAVFSFTVPAVVKNVNSKVKVTRESKKLNLASSPN
jgi:hypothetical protein